ncbi:hypothetical protein EHS25_005035 [Saitozyma podzolica]|uniref:Uncharacterized protein n=1 Tax=Saitozyma podzolica TaxID=1890683 RepID=A0A427Y272_9TREE|nr:hypothetical protein EHS25_005035 [Saitozyma podzolica]
MQTFLGASSPVLRYAPCRSCSNTSGWETGDLAFGTNSNGTDSGMVLRGNGSVSLNFTGVGLAFDMSYSSSPAWSTSFLVNSTSPPSSASIANSSITSLPYGHHLITLNLSPSSSSSSSSLSDEPWARLNAAQGDMGVLVSAQTTNQTIDDTAWRNWTVILTPGWNMLEKNASNWINTTQFDNEEKTAFRDFNSSISWTEQANAGNAVLFNGEAVWAYGVVGGEAGSYEVFVDNVSQGVYDGSGGCRVYDSVLFHASGLSQGSHNLTLRNVVQGQRLSFDRLVSTSNLIQIPSSIATNPAPPSTPAASASTWASSSTSASSSKGLSTGTQVGIGISGGAVILALIIWAIVAWTGCRARLRRKRDPDVKLGDDDRRQTFFRWSRREDRPFVPLFDAPGARVTRITAPLPGRSLNPDFVFPSPPSSAGVGTGGKDPSKHTKHTVKDVPPPAGMSFFSFSRKSSTRKGPRLGWFGRAKSSSNGRVEISNPIPLRSEVSAINFGGGEKEKDEGIERLDESKGQGGQGLGICSGHGFGDHAPLVDDGQRGLSGAALAAAVAGRTTSPLSALQHQARVVDVDVSSSVPPRRPNPTAKPLKSAMKSSQSAKPTTDLPSPENLHRDDESSYSFQTRIRDDTSGRDTLGGILSAYGRDSTGTGLAIGSPGDAERYASHLDAGPMPSSAIEERSPRRRFFGKAFDNGECDPK